MIVSDRPCFAGRNDEIVEPGYGTNCFVHGVNGEAEYENGNEKHKCMRIVRDKCATEPTRGMRKQAA